MVLRRRDVAGRARRGIVIMTSGSAEMFAGLESDPGLRPAHGLALVFAGIGQRLDSVSRENLFEFSQQRLVYQPV